MKDQTKELARRDREWVKWIGRRQLTAFERALADPKLTSLRQEIARVDLRLAELERQRPTGEHHAGWKRAGKIAVLLLAERERAEPDQQKITDWLTELEALTLAGRHDYETWAHIEAAIEVRRKLVDTERKYEELNQYLVPVTRLSFIFAELYAAISGTLGDPVLRRALINDLRTRLDGAVTGVDRRPVVVLPAPMRQLAAASLGDESDDEPLGGAPPTPAADDDADAGEPLPTELVGT